ncbi:MAG: hypothetical protein ACREM9_00265 [Gemmatimonadales bacterium]
MNALAEASRILGRRELTQGQLAQLRALDRKYAQRLYEGEREEVLRERLRAEIREIVSPREG